MFSDRQKSHATHAGFLLSLQFQSIFASEEVASF